MLWFRFTCILVYLPRAGVLVTFKHGCQVLVTANLNEDQNNV